MILLAGRTWFSSHGPTPVFTDSQQNGTKVMARLGDEVSNSSQTWVKVSYLFVRQSVCPDKIENSYCRPSLKIVKISRSFIDSSREGAKMFV